MLSLPSSDFVLHWLSLVLPDEGGLVPLGNAVIRAVPAHFLHSVGNFGFYDPTSRIFFSGDIGASLIPRWSGVVIGTTCLLQIAVGRGAFEPAAFDVFYLLVVLTVLRIPMLLLSARPPYRGKAWVDQGFLLLSYALSVILYSLAVTL